jgi:hypothetical protein
MQIDESPGAGSRFFEVADARRGSRIAQAIGGACSALGSCCGVAAIYYAHLSGGGSILHPSHSMLRAIAITVTALASTAQCAWNVFASDAGELD